MQSSKEPHLAREPQVPTPALGGLTPIGGLTSQMFPGIKYRR